FRRVLFRSLRGLPSCVAAFFLLLRCGQISSMRLLASRCLSGSESAARSYISRRILLRPYAPSSKGSIKLTSAGEAEVMVLPRGTPSPSTTTIHFEPFPRLVFPTSGPLFLQRQNCHQRRLPASSGEPCDPSPSVALAKRLTRYPRLPRTANGASRCSATGSGLVDPASARQSGAPTKCL